MTRSVFGTVGAVLALVLGGCATSEAPATAPTAGEPMTESVAEPTSARLDASRQEVLLARQWARDAGQAAPNGATVLLRFLQVTRDPREPADPTCVPGFVEELRADPGALRDAIVTRRRDGDLRVVAAGITIDIAVVAGRAVHLGGCDGPASLVTEAAEEAEKATQ